MECEINQSKSLMDKKEYKVMHVGDLEVLLVSTYGLCVEGRGIKEEELINCKAAAECACKLEVLAILWKRKV